MEHLFSPCARLLDEIENPDLLGGQNWADFELLQELNLNVSTEELLSAERAFTYSDLFAMLELGNQSPFAWLTPHAAVAREGRRALSCFTHMLRGYRLMFNVDGQEIYFWAHSSEALSDILDVVRRLLVADVREVSEVALRNEGRDLSINSTSLASLMEQCQSLKVLTLNNLEMDENHCRMLTTFSRLDLEIVLVDCAISDAGASALAEILGRKQGPTKLDQCEIDNLVLVNGLRRNSRLKSLKPRFSSDRGVGNQEILALAGALKENKGLVDLDLWHNFTMNDDTWGAICNSLERHPTLEVLNLRFTGGMTATAPAVIKSRIQVLLDMLKVNTSIHTIHLDGRYSQHELYRRLVIPYLDTNRLRPRLLVIQKTRPITYRVKVECRSFLSVDDYDDQSPNACYCCRYFQCCSCRRDCYSYSCCFCNWGLCFCCCRYSYCTSEAQGISLVPPGIYQITANLTIVYFGQVI
jgi:hypothetical protein